MTKEYAAECLEELLCDYQVSSHNYYKVAEIPIDPDSAEALKFAIKILKKGEKKNERNKDA